MAQTTRGMTFFRNTVFVAVAFFATQGSRASATYYSYSIWYTRCPVNWIQYQAFDSSADANNVMASLRANNPSYVFTIVTNTNGSRNPPTINPCGSSGGSGGNGGSGGGNGGGGGGSGGGCGSLYEAVYYYVVYTNSRGQSAVYQYYCCQGYATQIANSLARQYPSYRFTISRGYYRMYGNPACNTQPNMSIRCTNGVIELVPSQYVSSLGWRC